MDYFPFIVQTARDAFTYDATTDPSTITIESLTISPDAMSHHFIARAVILDLHPADLVKAIAAVEARITATYRYVRTTGWTAASDGLRLYFSAWDGR